MPDWNRGRQVDLCVLYPAEIAILISSALSNTNTLAMHAVPDGGARITHS